ncbi:MAG: molecular chaperone HtpG [Gammaproteobacteria bacterium]|nr:molecular chaperone HtpG [Gammaproteobacteria bacterium]
MTVQPQQETLGFQTEVKQLLHLVVHSLYSNKEIFLRELISNAADATDKLRFEALTDPALYESDADLKLTIQFDPTAKTITITDNGIGMSREEVIANLGTIARSGTREFLSQLTGDQKKDAHLIGQFGVGFYSAFIVADKVTVLTRRAGLTKEHGVRWESEGTGEYTIENIEKQTRGTEIILHIKDTETDFLNDWRLRTIVTRYSDHVNLPVFMRKPVEAKENESEKATTEWEQVNRAAALWTLSKNQITDEQYKDLYRHISHDFEDPLAWTHNQVEGGSLDYISLLYLPAHAPFDYWNRENTHGLKLYVQRVFIMDQVEQFMPHYLRFMRGIVDTNALPLNISREILQDNPVIPKLRAALVKRVLDLLEKLASDDPEKYAAFWKEFGNSLKEGPAEDFANRARVAKLLRFASTHSDQPIQNVSLEEYVKRMREGQKKIWYITADNFNTAKSSPHLEIFRTKQIEVLLLHDRIDEWLVNHLGEFEGHALQSVAKGDVDLSETGVAESEQDKAKLQEKEASLKTEFEPVIEQVKKILGDQVKEVRLSHRLTESPACLVADENDMSIQLQRLLKAAGQNAPEVKPVLELNPKHKLILRLKAESDQNRFSEWTHILFDQAMLAEGGQLANPAEFVQRMNRLLLELAG